MQFIKTHEQKSKLDLISELLVSESIEENIDLFKKVEANFFRELDVYKAQEEKRINLINNIKPRKEVYPHFDKPLSEIETNYEIINPCQTR